MKKIALAAVLAMGVAAPAFAQHAKVGHVSYARSAYGTMVRHDVRSQNGRDAYDMAVSPANSNNPALTGGGTAGYNWNLTHDFQ